MKTTPALIALIGLSLVSSPQAGPQTPAHETINRAITALNAKLSGFQARSTTTGPYPGYKLCRIMQRSIQRYHLGGHPIRSLNLTYRRATDDARRVISRASREAWLPVKSGWHEDIGNRPEYFRNELVPYGFQALELTVPGTMGGRIFVGVTDDHKNRRGLSAICIVGFEVP